MSILKELLAMYEAPEVPIELKDVIKAFPKQHGKALEKLWGGKRLVWHGKRFFDDHGTGEAYAEAEKAAEEFISDGYGSHYDMTVECEDAESGDLTDINLNVEFNFEAEHRQECYLGYDPQRDVLYIGFDCSISDEIFNEEWDKAFEEAMGEEYDHDNPQHEAAFQQAWDKYNKKHFGFWGVVFEVDHDFHCEEAFPPLPGGFYADLYRQFKQQHPNVIDLQLDS